MTKLAMFCLLGAVAAGGFGSYKVDVEHREVLRFRALLDIHQKLKDDANQVDEESQTYIGSALAQRVANTAQSLIDSTQNTLDQHQQQERVGYGFLVVSAVFLIGSVVLFRRHPRLGTAGRTTTGSESELVPITNGVPALPEGVPPQKPAQESNYMLLGIVGVLAVVIVAALVVSSVSSGPSSSPGGATNAGSPRLTPVPTVPSGGGNWQIDRDVSPVTGVVTTAAYLKYQGKQNIYIRQIGKKALQCYIETGDFLETMDNVESGVSPVQYRFDDGKVIRQGWRLSGDNEGLFYPGNCTPFLAQLRKSKSLAFEYPPADKVPATITFDVTGFPDEFRVDAPTSPIHSGERSGAL